MAFLLSFLLGVLALTRDVVEPLANRAFVVAAVAVIATFFLSARDRLHPLAQRTSAEDVAATLKFLIVAVVVLPLLPDRTYGPYEVFNPHKLGILLVLITGTSFVAYAAIRLLGPERGLGLTGLLGGLVSSTAVTLAMAARVRELGRAVLFALLFGAALLAAKAASVHLGASGTYAVGVLAGATDADAVALSMAELARAGGVAPAVAAVAVFLGVAANTLVKGILALTGGGPAFGRRVLGAQLVVLLTGAVGAVVGVAWLGSRLSHVWWTVLPVAE